MIQKRKAKHCRRSKDEIISDVLLWTTTHMDTPVLADRQKFAFRSPIGGKNGEKVKGIRFPLMMMMMIAFFFLNF